MESILNKKNQSGLTLVEMLITISLFATLSLVVFAIIISSYNIVSIQRDYVRLQQEGETALREITKTTNLAINITNYPEASPTYTSDNSNLVLKLNAIDTDNNPMANTYDYFVFYLDGDKLKLKIEADPASTGRADLTRTVASFVEKIIFRYNKSMPTEADIVYLTLIFSKETAGREKELFFQTSAYLRN